MVNYFNKISYLMIETNSQCNLKCINCNREELVSLGLRENKSLSLAEFKKLIDPFLDCPLDTIKIEGISEPMLNRHFDEIVNYVRLEFPKAFIIVATNLMYNINKVRLIESLPFIDMLYLSIDGTGEVFEKLRPGASYDKFLLNLKLLDEKLNNNLKNKLYLNFTLTEENYRCLPKIYEVNKKFGLAGVRINLAQNWNENELNKHKFSNELIQSLDQYKGDLKGVPGWSYSDCFWPFNGLIVDVYGDVRQCIINTSQKPIANIYTDNIKEIYNTSHHYRTTRDSLQKNCPPSNCKNCDYNYLSSILQKIIKDDNGNNRPRVINHG